MRGGSGNLGFLAGGECVLPPPSVLFGAAWSYPLFEVVRVDRRGHGCGGCQSGPVEEKLYPANRLGIVLIVAGVALAFLSFVCGFLFAVLGAALIVLGYLICRAA